MGFFTSFFNKHRKKQKEVKLVKRVPPTIPYENYSDALIKAARYYLKLKYKRRYPSGEYDSLGRWFPDNDEICECCGKISRPTKDYPYHYLNHVKSIKHVANRFDVVEEHLRLLIKEHAATVGKLDEIDFGQK